MTPDELLAIMEGIADIDSDTRAFVHNSSRAHAAEKLSQVSIALGRSMITDLENVTRYLSILDQHLLEHEHPPESLCYQRRCEAITIKADLERRLNLMDTLIAALVHYAHPENAN